MSAAFAGRLMAHLGLDSAQFQRGIQAAQTRSRGFAAAMAGAARFINPVTIALTAASAAAAAFTVPAMRAAAEIDNVAKAARRVDGSFTGWQAARLAAGEAGVAVEALADQVQNLNARLARPNPATQAALRQLGLSAADLRRMDVDQRLAAIANRVQALGLDAGQTTALLRDLGVENRQIANLIGAGGAAFAAARADIVDYGLALSEIDTGRIEEANDRIGRLSLVSRYLGQQLAVALVPALGRLAQAWTESLREGGLLRRMLDGIAAAVRVAVRAVESVVVIGAGFVNWLREGAGQSRGLVASIGAVVGIVRDLGAVLIQPVAWVYRLVTGFADLIRGAGSFGNALSLLGELAAGVWEGIVGDARAIPDRLAAVWHSLHLSFLEMIERLRGAWGDFLADMGDGIRESGLNIGGVMDGLADRLGQASGRMYRAAQAMSGQINQALAARSEAEARAAAISEAAWTRARAAMDALREAVARGGAESEAATAAQRELNLALSETEAAGGAAARGTRAAGDAARTMRQQIEGGADAMLGLLPAAQQGWQGVRQYLLQMIQQIMLAQMRLQMLQQAARTGGGGFLGWLGRMLAPAVPGAAFGVRNFAGGLATINERGGELVSLPRGATVIPHDLSKRMVDGAGGVTDNRTYNIDARGAQAGVAEQIVTALKAYDRALPGRVQQISANPRGR